MLTKEQLKARYKNACRHSKIWLKRPWWFNVQEPIGRFTGWLMVYTGLLIIVGALQLCTLNQGEKTNQEINRAVVYFDNLQFEPYPRDRPVTIAIETIVINSGNTPAYNIGMKFDCPDKSRVAASADPFEKAKLETRYDPPTFLGPKQRVILLACELAPSMVGDTQNGINAWYVAGEITYFDTFNSIQQHRTQISRNIRIDKFGGGSFGYVGKHNCADRDCP